ncbi:histone deacetylase [Paralimibaculum aggregatum]|uniref:Histone deacetylase n=1 Tax=Paralimibaculum aggregatum TaxID=3036245 RepID=A0ABQ6LBK0_9RHOB|nr:histone deacetylase [Limibaculum sp. NKW23]GMG80791.1 histone deacetylase [Limibaculum sp. NKW23]
MLPIVHHPDYRIPLRPRHPFPMSKYGYLREALEARGLISPGNGFAPAQAGATVIARAHDPDYVARVLEGRLAPEETRRIGLPGSAKVARRARLACAGTLLATWLALEHGLAANAAGGSHHAGPEGGAGYCVFNDVGVAAAAVLAGDGPAPVLVVDCDVHQGDGTARIFAEEPRVFTLSVHAARNYPAQKARSDLDLALPDGTGDADYLEALGAALEHALAAARPRLVYYNAGVDVWQGDRLGRLALTSGGIRARDRLVLGRIREAGLPLVCVLGGGYDDDPHRLAGHHAILFEEAARLAG